MLQMIPREPSGITVQQLRNKLSEIDPLYDVHKRTIERNLMQLVSIFPTLDYEEYPGGNRWFWQKDTVMDVPRLDTKTALMFRLAEAYLTPIFPRSTLTELKPHFKQAERTLKEVGDHSYSNWPNKVQVIQNSIRLRHPGINPEILAIVYDGLFEDRQFQATYRVRSGDIRNYRISPRGLVFRDGIVYAVCTLDERTEIRQLSLHRMISAESLDLPVVPITGFSLSEYVKTHFDYPLRALQINQAIRDEIPDTILLQIALDPVSAVHLQESSLSDDQKQEALPDHRILFTATVKNTERLRWWILSYGPYMEVIGPKELRSEIKDKITESGCHYKD